MLSKFYENLNFYKKVWQKFNFHLIAFPSFEFYLKMLTKNNFHASDDLVRTSIVNEGVSIFPRAEKFRT